MSYRELASSAFVDTASRLWPVRQNGPFSHAALARLLGESPGNFHNALNKPPGATLDRVARWIDSWNEQLGHPELVLEVGGGGARVRTRDDLGAKPPSPPDQGSPAAGKGQFAEVLAHHVREACRRVREEGVPPRRGGRSTFLVFEGEHMPAKYVLGLAYELAYGEVLPAQAYTGGEATARVLRILGFEVLSRVPARSSNTDQGERRRRSARVRGANGRRSAKDELEQALRKRFGAVLREATLPGLRVPSRDVEAAALRAVRRALQAHRGHQDIVTPGYAPRCDYFLPRQGIVVEVDERQHFSEPRRISLSQYPADVPLGFDRARWLEACAERQARDDHPPHRDEQRAYLDALRDLRIPELGYGPVVRVDDIALRGPDGSAEVLREVDEIAKKRPRPDGLRIATCSVLGSELTTATENPRRIELLRHIVREVEEQRWRPDVILLPGGYFFVPAHLGHREEIARRLVLEQQPFHAAAVQAAVETSCLVVAGVDGERRLRPGETWPDLGDQLCVAWGAHGICGVGRKVFPTRGESDEMVVYRSDLGTSTRLVEVRPRLEGLLCACYDLWGAAETLDTPGPRVRNIRWLGDGPDDLWSRKDDRRDFHENLSRPLRQWERLVGRAQVGLAAIHFFARSGPRSGKGYWQRHGVQKASTVLAGRRAFGAAHFEGSLPEPGVTVLAAANGEALLPTAWTAVAPPGLPSALVRLFDCE